MATALDMIKRAMRLIGVLSKGETPDDQDAADGLVSLNAMLGSWSNERLMIHVLTLDDVSLTPGKQVYTIGPGGEIDTVRPTSIDPSTYVLWNGVSYPVQVLNLQQYNGLALKGLEANIPEAIWYSPSYPLGQLTLYSVPTEAMTLKLWSSKPFTSFATLTTQVTLPPGYEEALAFNLAVRIAPEYETQPSAEVSRTAVTSKKLLKRTNLEVPQLSPVSDTLPRSTFNVYSGE